MFLTAKVVFGVIFERSQNVLRIFTVTMQTNLPKGKQLKELRVETMISHKCMHNSTLKWGHFSLELWCLTGFSVPIFTNRIHQTCIH